MWNCAKRRLITAAWTLAGTLVLATSAQAEAAACDRHCLESLVDRYLAAMLAHDPAALPMSADVKYTENQQRVPIGAGLWRDAESLSNYKIYAADPQRGQVGFMGAVNGGAHWTMIALRLRVIAGRIVEVEAVLPGRVADAGAFGFGDVAAQLITARPALSQVLTSSERATDRS